MQPSSAGLQASPPPVVAVLRPPHEPPLALDAALEMPPADMSQAVEEVTRSMSQNQAFMQHLQQVKDPVKYGFLFVTWLPSCAAR